MLQKAMTVLWPSFLAAIVAEGFFFSLLSPNDLPFSDNSIELGATGIYTVGFFCFWVFTALASLMTCCLSTTPND